MPFNYKQFQADARKAGFSQKEIDEEIRQRGLKQLGTLGSVGEGIMKVPRAVSPSVTGAVEQGVQGATSTIRDLLGGDIESVRARIGEGGEEPTLANLVAPAIPGSLGFKNSPAGAAVREIGLDVVIGAGASALGEKILPPVLSKVKGLIPRTIQKSARELASGTWKNTVEPLLKSEAGQKTVAKSDDVLIAMTDLYDEAMQINDKAALKEIAGVVDFVKGAGKNLTGEQLVRIGKRLKATEKLFSGATGQLTATYATDVGKQAAGGVSRKAYDIAKREVPGLTEGLSKYGAYSNLARQMKTPLKGWQAGAMLATLLGGVGLLNPATLPIIAPMGAAVAAGAAPYTRFLAKKGTSAAAKYSPAILIPILNQLNALMSQQGQQQ